MILHWVAIVIGILWLAFLFALALLFVAAAPIVLYFAEHKDDERGKEVIS